MIKVYVGAKVTSHNRLFNYEKSIFPGGEVHIKLKTNPVFTDDVFKIEAKITNSDEVMELLLLVDAIRRMYGNKEIMLNLPYIPYSRQDRVCNYGEALSLKVFCDLINACNFSSVLVYDPHSDVSTALLNNCVIVQQWDFVQNIDLKIENTILVSPDAGAVKKTLAIAQACGYREIYRADKIRDVQTGKITETIVYGEPTDKDFLIVDDICDGGRTFIELAKKLKELTTGNIYLYTTHAILSKGLAPLLSAGIKHLYTANVWSQAVNDDYITVVSY